MAYEDFLSNLMNDLNPQGGMMGANTNRYFTDNPDVAAAYANRANDPNLASTINMTPQQFAETHYQKFGINEGRAAPTVMPTSDKYQGMSVGGSSLPQGWENFSPEQKIAWYNANNITADQIMATGEATQADLDWMRQNGYNPPAEKIRGLLNSPTMGFDLPATRTATYERPVLSDLNAVREKALADYKAKKAEEEKANANQVSAVNQSDIIKELIASGIITVGQDGLFSLKNQPMTTFEGY